MFYNSLLKPFSASNSATEMSAYSFLSFYSLSSETVSSIFITWLKTHYGRVQRQNPKIVSWSKKWLNQTLKHLMSHCLMGNSQPITGRHHFLAPPYSLPIGPYKGATFRTTSHNAVNVSTILYLYCRRKSRCSLQLCMFLSTGGTITKNIFLYLNCCITGWRRCNIKLIWIILYLQ